MTLPPDVEMRTATFGRATSYAGNNATIVGTVTANQTIVHEATGIRICPDADPMQVAGGELMIDLPTVDQAGFLNGQRVPYTGWMYVLNYTITYASGKTESGSQEFQLFSTDPSVVDVDLRPDGPFVPGTTGPQTNVVQVAGLGGPVVSPADLAAALEGDLAATFATLIDEALEDFEPGGGGASSDFGVTPGVPMFNLANARNSTWAAGVGDVLAGVASTVLACAPADSTGYSTGATNQENGWPAKTVLALRAAGIPAARTFATTHGGDFPDSRVTTTGGWQFVEGMWNLPQGATGTLTYAPSSASGPATVDRLAVGMVSAASVALPVAFNGASAGTINAGTGGALVTRTANASGVLTAPTITITGTAVADTVFIHTLNAYDSTTPVVQVASMGIPGSGVSTWLNQGQPWRPGELALYLAASLYVIDLGINDSKDGGTAADYATAMQTLITRFKAVGDVLLKSFVPSDPDGPYPSVSNQPQFVARLRRLASSNQIAMADINARWVDYDTSAALGRYADALHPSNTGYADVAVAVLAALRSL